MRVTRGGLRRFSRPAGSWSSPRPEAQAADAVAPARMRSPAGPAYSECRSRRTSSISALWRLGHMVSAARDTPKRLASSALETSPDAICRATSRYLCLAILLSDLG